MPVDVNGGSALIERQTDYAINILWVLGFLTSGDGGTEAGRLMGILGLPHSTSMQKRFFSSIESRISPHVIALCDEVLTDNLKDEVKLFYNNKRNADGVLVYDLWARKELPNTEDWPRLAMSTDMAWQKRSSGKRYDSLSGHALLCSTTLRKPVMKEILAKSCRICKVWHLKHPIDEAAPDHKCTRNHEGSSGSMEPIAVLKMVVRMYQEHNVVVSPIITDDDSSIKAKLKWSNANHMLKTNTTTTPKIINSNGNLVTRPDKGELPLDMDEPKFLADPIHRKKTLKGELYRLESQKVANKKTLTKCDCVRISTNFAYMSRTLSTKTVDEYEHAAQAVLEHHFDNHEFCGDFCLRKNQTEDEKKSSTNFYRSKENDKELYELLQTKLARFVTKEALIEVGHGMDTLVNESLNNTISWLAPKNKTYSTSMSLTNRICVALIINTRGILGLFELLFDRLGISMQPDVLYFLTQIDAIRTKRIKVSKTTKAKKKRQKAFHNKLKEHNATARKERAKRTGEYCPGIGMDGGYTGNEVATNNPKPRQKRAKVTCPLCGGSGHKTAKSKKCGEHPDNKKNDSSNNDTSTAEDNNNADEPKSEEPTDKPNDSTERDAKELALFDQLGFDDDNDEFFDSFEDEDDIDDSVDLPPKSK